MTTTVLEATDKGLVNTETGELVGEGELFDPKPYQTPVPTLDGHRADTLKLAFAGGVEIDKLINDDLEHFKNLRFGQELVLRITGVVGKNGWTIKTNSEGEETVTNTIGILVHSYTVDPEDM